MSFETLVFGLWLATFVLVLWQVVLTVEFGRLRRQAGGRAEGGIDFVNMGLMYNGLIEEFRDTADEKIALLERRIEELEDLLDEGNVEDEPGSRVRWLHGDIERVRRFG